MFWQPVRQRVQSELIRRGHCVGCTRSLAIAHRETSSQNKDIEVVTCECQRVYLYDRRINSYRRAIPKEVLSHTPHTSNRTNDSN